VRQGDWLAQQLPAGMLEDEFLLRFVRIFQDVSDTVFDQIDTLPFQFDPRTAPPSMVRQLGRWLGFRVDSAADPDVQRRLVIVGARELPWRGTERCVRALVEVITGCGPVVISDSGGVYGQDDEHGWGKPPHVVIRVTDAGMMTEGDLARFIRNELPASTTLELYVAGRLVWPEAARQPVVEEEERVA
jgi:phage tail-like protein